MKHILTFWTCDRCNPDGENFDGIGRVQAESWIDANLSILEVEAAIAFPW